MTVRESFFFDSNLNTSAVLESQIFSFLFMEMN